MRDNEPPSTASSSQKDSQTLKRDYSDTSSINPRNLKSNLQTPSISSRPSEDPPELTSTPGYRAAEAYIRPSPIVTVGTILSTGFNLKTCVFELSLDADKATADDTPTEIFLPEFHFPKDRCVVEVSGGKWSISTDEESGGLFQKMRWWHQPGEQFIKVKGVPSRQIMGEDEDGYLEQCQQGNNCSLM